ncbi:UNVERIFIED_CONTAM: hypothetical protein FKN15_002764 [Acipenser sinensis]
MEIGMCQKAKRTIILNIESDIKYRTIHNVIGYLKGITDPDRYVLLGSYHDSWYDKNGLVVQPSILSLLGPWSLK